MYRSLHREGEALSERSVVQAIRPGQSRGLAVAVRTGRHALGRSGATAASCTGTGSTLLTGSTLAGGAVGSRGPAFLEPLEDTGVGGRGQQEQHADGEQKANRERSTESKQFHGFLC